eukprot:TRINITY_DN808_c0_g1_i1.p3 TRINITY_DN808_c0_g1~~TRINITY_DN808_c0_g1_i1.p3  ORF type:complete len:186 (-),score=70.64 TRINITY_DN808_c0_g1_i1:537-1094(-)
MLRRRPLLLLRQRRRQHVEHARRDRCGSCGAGSSGGARLQQRRRQADGEEARPQQLVAHEGDAQHAAGPAVAQLARHVDVRAALLRGGGGGARDGEHAGDERERLLQERVGDEVEDGEREELLAPVPRERAHARVAVDDVAVDAPHRERYRRVVEDELVVHAHGRRRCAACALLLPLSPCTSCSR